MVLKSALLLRHAILFLPVEKDFSGDVFSFFCAISFLFEMTHSIDERTFPPFPNLLPFY